MELPVLVPIEYRGKLVALVSQERVHIAAPRLLTCLVGDPELRFVAFMCACSVEVLAGRLRGPYTDALGTEWAQIASSQEASAAPRPLAARRRRTLADHPYHAAGRPTRGVR